MSYLLYDGQATWDRTGKAAGTPNRLPAVSITSPASGAAFAAPTTIAIQASASDPDGSIAKVEFFEGVTKLGETYGAPYQLSWSNVTRAREYSLTARATDNRGATATSAPVKINVNAYNQAPSVAIASPAAGATFTAPASIAIQASAADPDGTIAKVEFYQGTTKLGEDATAPYAFTWSNVSAGSYSLTVKAIDNLGVAAASAAVAITVTPPNQPPSVSIASPANNAVFVAPAAIAMTATASDPDAGGSIAKVEFFQGATKLGESTAAPYQLTWSDVPAGSYALTAKATDNMGAVTTSAAVTVKVDTLPAVAITAPLPGTLFVAPATIAMTATASDPDAGGSIAKVEFFQGATKLGEDTTAPYAFTWSNVPNGTYSLTARATDNLGKTTTSAPVTVTVGGADVAFVKADTSTQGTWKGVYGSEGYNVIADAASYPSYVQGVTPSGHSPRTWVNPTTDVRALQKSASAIDRVAACWYASGSFDIKVSMTAGQRHRVAVYCLDWDGNGARKQRIDVLDAVTLATLDSRTIAGFQNGAYLVWDINGQVILRVTNLGSNAVVGGLFFSPAAAIVPPAVPAIATLNNKKINDYTPVVQGTAAPAVTVRVYEGAVELGKGQAGLDGAWTIHTTIALADGPHAFVAKAANGGGESGASNAIDMVIDTLGPAAPANLRVVPCSTAVDLFWDASPDPDVLGYNVYRRLNGQATYVKINPKRVVAPRYRDAGLSNGTVYEYKVTAVDNTLDERSLYHP
jgi:hypothetical protein